jgi:AcrR family transcriptional regulator
MDASSRIASALLGGGSEPSSVTPLAEVAAGGRPRVRQRTKRRVLDAARQIVGTAGLGALSMRALADRAGVSATTLYNLFGTKDAVVQALAEDVLGTLDAAFEAISDADPITQLRRRLLYLVDLLIEQVPPSLVAAVLDDAVLIEQMNAQWSSRTMIEDGIRAAVARGHLRGDLDATIVAEHVRAGLLHHERLWAAGVDDDDALRAGVTHALDLALYAMAQGPTRRRMLALVQADQTNLAHFPRA